MFRDTPKAGIKPLTLLFVEILRFIHLSILVLPQILRLNLFLWFLHTSEQKKAANSPIFPSLLPLSFNSPQAFALFNLSPFLLPDSFLIVDLQTWMRSQQTSQSRVRRQHSCIITEKMPPFLSHTNSSCRDLLWASEGSCFNRVTDTCLAREGDCACYFLPTGATCLSAGRKKSLQKGMYDKYKTCREVFVLLQA